MKGRLDPSLLSFQLPGAVVAAAAARSRSTRSRRTMESTVPSLLPYSMSSLLPRSTGVLDRFLRRTQSSRTESRKYFARAMIAGIALATGLPGAPAGPVTAIGLSGQSPPTPTIELDQTARTIVEVELAIKRFEQRDFEQCIHQLSKARAAHPELPPTEALFAKLAFMGNQGAVIRPALERAVAEDGKHPEVYILFGNLALAEGRHTDATVHFKKAVSLAASPRWTVEERDRVALLCKQGGALIAENRRDWKAAKAALEAWLKAEPSHAAGAAAAGKGALRPGRIRRRVRSVPNGDDSRSQTRAGACLDGVAVRPVGKRQESRRMDGLCSQVGPGIVAGATRSDCLAFGTRVGAMKPRATSTWPQNSIPGRSRSSEPSGWWPGSAETSSRPRGFFRRSPTKPPPTRGHVTSWRWSCPSRMTRRSGRERWSWPN